MKANTVRLNVELARSCKSLSDLRDKVSPSTLKKVRNGEDVRPVTLGKIARALGVDVTEIMEEVGA